MTIRFNIYADHITAGVLNSAFQHFQLSDACYINSTKDIRGVTIEPHGTSEKFTFDCPVRLGKVIDFIEKNINSDDLKTGVISIGNMQLDTFQGTLTKPNGEGISLTEKEVSILEFLYQLKGQSITRDDLLEAVWGYADGVETHTLETHIYRLRQKLEVDPANPAILTTQDDGYALRLN